MNRAFYIPGFKQRVKQVLDEQGKTGAEVAALCGFERKALYNEDWHGGRIAKFCEVTGTDANWLLGVRGPDLRRYKESKSMTEEELKLIKRVILIICRNIRPDGELGYLDWEDRCTMQNIYHELVKKNEEQEQ